MSVTPSDLDQRIIRSGRQHIAEHRHAAIRAVEGLKLHSWDVLEVGPAKPTMFDTLDIKPGRTYLADITQRTQIRSDAYSVVMCLDVLEHVVDPFSAVAEIRRILKPGGLLYASAPFNVREHGPLPDCWR